MLDDQNTIVSPNIKKSVEPCRSIFEKLFDTKNWLSEDFIYEGSIVYSDIEGDIRPDCEPEEETMPEELYILKIKPGTNLEEKNRLFEEMKVQIGAEFELVAQPTVPEAQADEPVSEPPKSIENSEELIPPLKIGSGVGEDSPAAMSVPLLEDGTPALWAKRTTGREVTAVDFIREHFGSVREWTPMEGLTRSALSRLDPDLASAYATWINRHPEDTLPIPTKPHTRRPADFTSSSPHSFWTPTANLTSEEKKARREYEALKKRRQRARHQNL